MKKEELIEKINFLRKEKNAIILAHYYQEANIQDIADCVGDSLALAQWAAKTDAAIIVLCGVHFMAETAKILCPDKKVVIPDINAGCSLANSCPVDEFENFVKNHAGYMVISYINTSAAVKALSDVIVTSSNARKIVESFPKDEKIIFAPDRNLGNYINSITGRQMLLWEGACHVHEQFSIEKLIQLKKEYPEALVLAHPECTKPVLMMADYIGSTQALLNFATVSDKKIFLIATESGILHQMKKKNPDKQFIPVPPNDSTCACNECNFMRLNTLEKVYKCLLNESPEVLVEEEIRKKAIKPIQRMLELS